MNRRKNENVTGWQLKLKSSNIKIHVHIKVKMGKALSEMTLEELWTLFPIILIKHKPYWKEWYEEEKIRIHKFIKINK